jgi:putative sterol carrier protein
LVVQFEIGGDAGGTWGATIKLGELHLSEGPVAAPNLTLQISQQDWLDMVAGTKPSQLLFMTGKLKIKGDITLALRLASLLRI